MLPEMALIGYRFDNRQDIADFVEQVPDNYDQLLAGIDEEDAAIPCTFKWASRVSRSFAPAWVAVGFAEKDAQDRYFNSAVVLNYDLRICHVVRKTLLFIDDNKWASTEESVSGVEYNF